MVSLWVHKEKAAREVNSPHSGRVRLVKWAPAGNRLLTADEGGVFAVWKVDHRFQLVLSAQYARQGSLTHCVFATRAAAKEKTAKAYGDHFPSHLANIGAFDG